MMLSGAATFKRRHLFEQLVFETTTLGVKLDMQTYVKCFRSLAPK